MAKRWSKLQTTIYELIDPKIDFQIHVTPYRMDSQMGSTNLGRYWITLDGEILFDYPGQVPASEHEDFYPYGYNEKTSYVSRISQALRDYYDCPKDQLLTRTFGDAEPVIDLIRAADRRIGRQRLLTWGKEKDSVHGILKARGWL